jgi:RNA polymerase sigma-70 factor (ECF subfamily)
MSKGFDTELCELRPRLLQQAFKLTKDRAAAEDLVSSAMLRAIASREQYTPGPGMGAWVYVIMRNVFLTEKRRIREEEWNDIRDNNCPSVDNPDAVSELGDVLATLRRLPRDQQAVLLLLAGGFDYGEIAEKLELSEGTVKSRIFRARRSLDEWLPDKTLRASTGDACAEMLLEIDAVLREIETGRPTRVVA